MIAANDTSNETIVTISNPAEEWMWNQWNNQELASLFESWGREIEASLPSEVSALIRENVDNVWKKGTDITWKMLVTFLSSMLAYFMSQMYLEKRRKAIAMGKRDDELGIVGIIGSRRGGFGMQTVRKSLTGATDPYGTVIQQWIQHGGLWKLLGVVRQHAHVIDVSGKYETAILEMATRIATESLKLSTDPNEWIPEKNYVIFDYPVWAKTVQPRILAIPESFLTEIEHERLKFADDESMIRYLERTGGRTRPSKDDPNGKILSVMWINDGDFDGPTLRSCLTLLRKIWRGWESDFQDQALAFATFTSFIAPPDVSGEWEKNLIAYYLTERHDIATEIAEKIATWLVARGASYEDLAVAISQAGKKEGWVRQLFLRLESEFGLEQKPGNETEGQLVTQWKKEFWTEDIEAIAIPEEEIMERYFAELKSAAKRIMWKKPQVILTWPEWKADFYTMDFDDLPSSALDDLRSSARAVLTLAADQHNNLYRHNRSIGKSGIQIPDIQEIKNMKVVKRNWADQELHYPEDARWAQRVSGKALQWAFAVDYANLSFEQLPHTLKWKNIDNILANDAIFEAEYQLWNNPFLVDFSQRARNEHNTWRANKKLRGETIRQWYDVDGSQLTEEQIIENLWYVLPGMMLFAQRHIPSSGLAADTISPLQESELTSIASKYRNDSLISGLLSAALTSTGNSLRVFRADSIPEGTDNIIYFDPHQRSSLDRVSWLEVLTWSERKAKTKERSPETLAVPVEDLAHIFGTTDNLRFMGELRPILLAA